MERKLYNETSANALSTFTGYDQKMDQAYCTGLWAFMGLNLAGIKLNIFELNNTQFHNSLCNSPVSCCAEMFCGRRRQSEQNFKIFIINAYKWQTRTTLLQTDNFTALRRNVLSEISDRRTNSTTSTLTTATIWSPTVRINSVIYCEETCTTCFDSSQQIRHQ